MRARAGMIFRLFATTSLIALMCVALPGNALAKISDGTVETSPATPAGGEPIRVTVRAWSDGNHTSVAPLDELQGLNGYLIARMTGSNDLVRAPLLQSEPGRFDGTISLPAGDWTLTAFLGRTEWDAYPVPPIAITVQTPSPGLSAVMAALIVVAAALLVVFSRWPSPAGWAGSAGKRFHRARSRVS